jgi:hypothetical protein
VYAVKNQEAARVILADRRYQGSLMERWARLVLERAERWELTA